MNLNNVTLFDILNDDFRKVEILNQYDREIHKCATGNILCLVHSYRNGLDGSSSIVEIDKDCKIIRVEMLCMS